MRSPSRRSVALAIALAAGLTASVAVAAGGASRPGATGSDLAAPANDASVLFILAEKKTPEDDIPPGFAGGEDESSTGIDLSTTRLLLKDETGSYYAARSNSGYICLVVYAPDDGSMGSCTSVQQFMKRGTGSTFQSPDTYREAYLVPDGTSANANTAGLTVHGRNLLVGDTRELPEEQIIQRLPTITGTWVELQLLGIR